MKISPLQFFFSVLLIAVTIALVLFSRSALPSDDDLGTPRIAAPSYFEWTNASTKVLKCVHVTSDGVPHVSLGPCILPTATATPIVTLSIRQLSNHVTLVNTVPPPKVAMPFTVFGVCLSHCGKSGYKPTYTPTSTATPSAHLEPKARENSRQLAEPANDGLAKYSNGRVTIVASGAPIGHVAGKLTVLTSGQATKNFYTAPILMLAPSGHVAIADCYFDAEPRFGDLAYASSDTQGMCKPLHLSGANLLGIVLSREAVNDLTNPTPIATATVTH